MRRWKPRRPSPKVRHAIFGRPALVRTAARGLGDFSRWLVPACGCFLLVVGTLSQRAPYFATAGTDTNYSGLQGGGRILLAEMREHSEKNAIPATRLEQRLAGSILPQNENPSLDLQTNHLNKQ